MKPCEFCGVLPQYGHFDWCKIDRAPTAEEIVCAVLDERDRSIGYDGPSATLAGMCEAYLAHFPHTSIQVIDFKARRTLCQGDALPLS